MATRTCPKGHAFTKTSDCPTCPMCAADARPADGFFAAFSGPTRSALAHAGIDGPSALAKHTEKEVLALHGIGKASLPALRKALADAGLAFAPPPARAPREA